MFGRSLLLQSVSASASNVDDSGLIKIRAMDAETRDFIDWDQGAAPPFRLLVPPDGFISIYDETNLDAASRRELFLHFYPTLCFGGRYTVVAGEDGNGLDAAFAGLASMLARGAIAPSRARLMHGRSATAYAEVMTEEIRFRKGEITLIKSHSEGEPLKVFEAVQSSEFPGDWQEVLPVEPYSRTPPVIHDNPPWLNNRLAEAIARGGEIPRSGHLGILKDVTVLGDGIIRNNAGYILAESLQNTAHERIIPYFYRVSDTTYTSLGWADGCRAVEHQNLVLLKQPYDGNYGHWLMESLPRMGLVAERFDPATCHVLVMGWYQPMIPVFQESLNWCGVPREQIIVSANTPLNVPRGIFPTPISRPPWVFAPFAIRYLEKIANNVHTNSAYTEDQSPKKVYLSRDKFTRRRITNEDEILAVMNEFGYSVFYPEQLSFSQQVLMMRTATHVVANMGAALTNVVFAPKGVRVLALATEHMPDDFFWDITSQKNGTYLSLHGKATEPAKGAQSDFVVDIGKLRDIVERMEGM